MLGLRQIKLRVVLNSAMQFFSNIEKVSGRIAIPAGKFLLAVFSATILASALLRYLFSFGHVMLNDLAQYSFAALVMLAVLIAFIGNKHVRVRSMMRLLKRVRFCTLGFFDRGLLPALVFFVLAALSIPGVLRSWVLLEGSTEPNGLDGYFLIKSILPIVLVLIGLWLWRSPIIDDDRT